MQKMILDTLRSADLEQIRATNDFVKQFGVEIEPVEMMIGQDFREVRETLKQLDAEQIELVKGFVDSLNIEIRPLEERVPMITHNDI